MFAFARVFLLFSIVVMPYSVTLAADSNSVGTVGTVERMRAALLKKYDANENGRLDTQEREKIRKDRKQAAERSWTRSRGRSWEPPKKWMKLYDKDDDGELSDAEVKVAFDTESELMTKSYDKNSDGKLDDEEQSAIKEDLESKKYEGIEAYMAMRISGAFDRRGRRGDRSKRNRSREEVWLDFDKDGDGKASRQELAEIRRHELEARSAN